MLDTAPNLKAIDPDKVWSVANGGIKLVDLTRDTLADFESYKKQAETLYGTADDPFQSSPEASGRKVIYGFRLADVDPTSWLPQWVNPGDAPQEPPATDLGDRMQSLLSVNGEHGPEQVNWSRRVLDSWLKRQTASTTGDEAPASGSAVLAAQRSYDRQTTAAA